MQREMMLVAQPRGQPGAAPPEIAQGGDFNHHNPAQQRRLPGQREGVDKPRFFRGRELARRGQKAPD